MIPQKVKIDGWPYYITIDGQVWREDGKHPLRPIRGRDGYHVTLSDGKRRKDMRLNNLMREAYFGGNPLPLVHKDGNALNFAYWNLQPTPRRLVPKAHSERGWFAKPVVRIAPDGTETIYPSAAEAGRQNYISACNIRARCRGVYKGPAIDGAMYRWEEA